ncbi:MAG: DUF2723 domain-containing protein [Candidatus Helarchaeota archaeon]|nr:DUF2723 domain-containing protein [Candidatus Helarchaeota archaeon]
MNRETKLTAIAIFIISLTVYIITIAPTVSFWDCGEFISCSYIMGIPHPPGAPLYIMIGRFFTLLPFFDVAVRVNFISALSSAVVVAILFLIIVRLIKEWRGESKTVEDKILVNAAGFIGALSYAFSDSFWFNAVEAEVYALSMLFTALVLWLAIVWMDNFKEYKSVRFLLFIVYFFGLGAGVHLLNLLVIPTIFLLIIFTDRRVLLRIDLWGIVPLLLILGYSTYLMILIRSGMNPAIDENNPENLENFAKYLNREQYGTESQFLTFFNRKAPLWSYQIKKMFLRYFGWQFIGKGTTIGPDGNIAENLSFRGLIGLPFLLGLVGMVHHFYKDWKRALSVLIFFIMTGIAIVIYLNQPDPQPRERDYVYVGCFFAFAIWIGIGMVGILEGIISKLREKSKLIWLAIGGAIFLVTLALPVNMCRFNFHEHDRSGNYVAWDYSYNILQSCEPNAIIFTNGDNDTFPLWYLQEVENIRKDVRVISLPLLNTGWYTLQLKHQEPKVPINYPDEEIKELGGYFRMDGTKTVKIVIEPRLNRYYMREMEGIIPFKDENTEMVFQFEPTAFDGKAIRSQDYMIYIILQSFNFMKPLYFAVTVEIKNMLGLKDFLRNDGLAYKVITVKGHPVVPEIMKRNLLEKFKFRNLDNPKVYYDRQTILLLHNCRKAFLDLVIHEYNNKRPQEALKILDKMFELIPEETIHFLIDEVIEQVGKLYYQLGRPEELEKRLDILIKRNIADSKKYEFARIYSLNLRKNEKAIDILKGLIKKNPDNGQYVGTLVTLLESEKDYKNALNYLDFWITNHPNDKNAIERRDKLLNKISPPQDTLHMEKNNHSK